MRKRIQNGASAILSMRNIITFSPRQLPVSYYSNYQINLRYEIINFDLIAYKRLQHYIPRVTLSIVCTLEYQTGVHYDVRRIHLGTSMSPLFIRSLIVKCHLDVFCVMSRVKRKGSLAMYEQCKHSSASTYVNDVRTVQPARFYHQIRIYVVYYVAFTRPK